MEVPQVIIKQEILDSSTLTTEPQVNYETQTLDEPQIKLESVKLESCTDISEDMSIPTNLDHQLKLSEETKMIENDPNYMMDSSLYKRETKQEDLDIKLEGSEEIEKIEELVDAQWKVKNDELNIKEDENDEEYRNSSKLVLENRHGEDTASSKKKKMNRNSFTCDQCEYKTSKHQYLKMHLEKHKKPGIYKCDQCDYQTIHKRYLRKHLLIHKNLDEAELHKCNQCDYKTLHKGNLLRSHILLHKKPNEVVMYKCDQCDYQTLQKSNLKKHSLKHKNPDDDVDMYKCDQCNYQSVRKQGFKRHLEKHVNPVERVLYKCGQCDVNMQYQTFSKTNLRRHLLKHKQL